MPKDLAELPDRDDHTLVERARAGDRAALEALLERHQGRILRFSMKMCGHPEDAEDVLQETMLAAARTVGEFRGASSISTWLWTIARSFCIKKRRKSKFAPEFEESIDRQDGAAIALPDPARDPEQTTAGRQIEVALDEAIRALDPGNREVLLLRDVEGLSANEVADVLGISVLAVKSRLHRARVAVRERVAPLLGRAATAPATPACPDVVDLLSRHLEGEISAGTCAEMEQHLEGCGHCRDACDSLKSVLAMCRAAPAAEVPESIKQKVRFALRAVVGVTAGS